MTLARALIQSRFFYGVRRLALREIFRFCPSRGRRVVTVFDPSLLAFHGHHMEFARMIKEEWASRFDLRFYAHFRASTKVVLSLPAQPVCRDQIYPPHDKNFDDAYRMMTVSTINALKWIIRRDLGSKAIFIMHTATLYQLGGLAQWLEALPRADRPTVCIQFQFPLEFGLSGDTGERERALNLARAAAAKLMKTARIRFAANSELLAQQISCELEQHCSVLPLPVKWPDSAQPLVPDAGVVFGFLGGLRSEKGASILATAIPQFAARYPETRFIVHAPSSESDASVVETLRSVQQVELIQHSFSEKADYFSQLKRASCILLPYDPAAYALRTSGILIEALGLNRLIITTKESWLWSEATRRGGKVIGMPKFAPEALFSSLVAARDFLRREQIETKANLDVMAENSPAAFCAALFALADRQ